MKNRPDGRNQIIDTFFTREWSFRKIIYLIPDTYDKDIPCWQVQATGYHYRRGVIENVIITCYLLHEKMGSIMNNLFLFSIALLMVWIPTIIFAGECKEHIELHSAAYLTKEYGKSEMWVLNNVKINLWKKPTHLGKGRKAGHMLPGSRAIIHQTSKEDCEVKSPLDKSIGWINKVQLMKTLFQDTETRKTCSLKWKYII